MRDVAFYVWSLNRLVLTPVDRHWVGLYGRMVGLDRIHMREVFEPDYPRNVPGASFDSMVDNSSDDS